MKKNAFYIALPIFLLMELSGCASKEVVQAPPPPPRVPVSQELNAILCPDGDLRGTGLAGDYEQAMNNAVSQIATQIQSSMVRRVPCRPNRMSLRLVKKASVLRSIESPRCLPNCGTVRMFTLKRRLLTMVWLAWSPVCRRPMPQSLIVKNT